MAELGILRMGPKIQKCREKTQGSAHQAGMGQGRAVVAPALAGGVLKYPKNEVVVN